MIGRSSLLERARWAHRALWPGTCHHCCRPGTTHFPPLLTTKHELRRRAYGKGALAKAEHLLKSMSKVMKCGKGKSCVSVFCFCVMKETTSIRNQRRHATHCNTSTYFCLFVGLTWRANTILLLLWALLQCLSWLSSGGLLGHDHGQGAGTQPKGLEHGPSRLAHSVLWQWCVALTKHWSLRAGTRAGARAGAWGVGSKSCMAHRLPTSSLLPASCVTSSIAHCGTSTLVSHQC